MGMFSLVSTLYRRTGWTFMSPERATFAVTRDGEGLKDLVERLQVLTPNADRRGGDRRLRDDRGGGNCQHASLPLAVVNPAQVHRFAQALGKRAKTGSNRRGGDRPLQKLRSPSRARSPTKQLVCSAMIDRRRQITEMLVAERRREKRCDGCPESARAWARHIKVLKEDLQAISDDIGSMVRSSPDLAAPTRISWSASGRGRQNFDHRPGDGSRNRSPQRSKRSPASSEWHRSPSIRSLEEQEHDCRWPCRSAHRNLHGRSLCQPAQPRLEGLLSTPPRGRKAKDGRPHRGRS